MKSLATAGCAIALILAELWAAQDAPKMYLCSDSLAQKKEEAKRVYGYINGEKTACMSEYEFLALYSKSVFDADSVSRAEKKQQAMQEAKAGGRSAADELVEKIRAGKKDLDGCDLMGANLSGADLEGASLVSADMRAANLSQANLSQANLKAAFLKKANLQGANFSNARCQGTYFLGADLRGARGLTLEQLKDVKTLHKAKLDNEVLAVVKAQIPEKLKEPKKCWADNAWSDNEDCEPSKKMPTAR